MSTLFDDVEPTQKYGRQTNLSQEDFIKQYFGHDVLAAKAPNHDWDLYIHSD